MALPVVPLNRNIVFGRKEEVYDKENNVVMICRIRKMFPDCGGNPGDRGDGCAAVSRFRQRFGAQTGFPSYFYDDYTEMEKDPRRMGRRWTFTLTGSIPGLRGEQSADRTDASVSGYVL